MPASLSALCYILRVPGELIFNFLEYLLPVILDAADSRYSLCRGDLSDLLHCRLVCHAFYEISSSLVWRRVKFTLPGYKSPTQSAVSAAYGDASSLTEVTDYLINNPRFVNDTRLLIMIANGPLYEQALHRTTVTTLSNVVPLLANIRVLSLDNVSIVGSRIMLQLFLCPVLHTVRLNNIDFSSLSVGRAAVNPSIKSLGIQRCQKVEKLFKLMPSVRAFDGEIDEASARMSRWGSLEEISFRNDIPKWDELARRFISWRQFRRNVSPSLTELMISQWQFNPKIRDLGSILRPFAGNPLTRLILYYVEEPSIDNLELIIHFFPGLQHLSLLSDEELAQWPGNIESYSHCLSRLGQLQLLEWNFYDGHDNDRTVYGDWNMISEDRLSEIALSLADGSPNLEEVRFCLMIDGYMALTLHKDGFGNSDVENISYSDSLLFCTSSWHPSSFRDV